MDIILTKEGKEKIEKELKFLKDERRPEIIDKISSAKELGDLSENAEYHDAKDQQGMIEARINEIEDILKKAVIADVANAGGKIQIGSTFKVEDLDGRRKTLTIVGFNEANPIEGKISNESPMGQAFLRKEKGDEVKVETPKGSMLYKIIEVA